MRDYGYDLYNPTPPYWDQPGVYGYVDPYYGIFYPQSQYRDADVELFKYEDGNSGDSITIDEGQTLSILLPISNSGVGWELDTDSLDTYIIEKKSHEMVQGSFCQYEQWIFEARNPGTTNIILEFKNYKNNEIEDTFEVEVYYRGLN